MFSVIFSMASSIYVLTLSLSPSFSPSLIYPVPFHPPPPFSVSSIFRFFRLISCFLLSFSPFPIIRAIITAQPKDNKRKWGSYVLCLDHPLPPLSLILCQLFSLSLFVWSSFQISSFCFSLSLFPLLFSLRFFAPDHSPWLSGVWDKSWCADKSSERHRGTADTKWELANDRSDTAKAKEWRSICTPVNNTTARGLHHI